MENFFTPLTKNPPAKVKDKGIISLVLRGAGAYNAKGGELLLLPSAFAEKDKLLGALLELLFGAVGFQPVDCDGSENAVFTLAERYVREYKEQALFWSQENGRYLELYGWGASGEEIISKMESAAGAISAAVDERAPLVFLTGSQPGCLKTLKGVSLTEKGAENALPGCACANCGAKFLPDSQYGGRQSPENAETEEELKEVYTPGAHTIPLLCEYLDVPVERTLKAMLYTMETADGGRKLLFAMIRGDKDVSIPKLAAWVEANYPGADFRRAEEAEIIEGFGEVAGFCGPVNVPGNVQMVADLSLENAKNLVCGGNRPDYHITGCCWDRDFRPPVADLALYSAGQRCPQCGGELSEAWFRQICQLEYYTGDSRGENILSCRDREGTHSWPHRLRGKVSLIQAILAIYENKGGNNGDD